MSLNMCLVVWMQNQSLKFAHCDGALNTNKGL